MINEWIAEVTQQQRQTQRILDRLRAASANRRQPLDPAMVRALLEELGNLAAGLDLADPTQREVLPGDGDQRPVQTSRADRADHRQTGDS